MAAAVSASGKKGFQLAFYKWLYSSSRYNQYGLRTSDMYREGPAVAEAVRRLPDYMQDERAFRLHRAMHYCMLKQVLPKEQWIDAEDPDNWYLKPYLEEVEREIAERKEWAEK